MKQAASLESGGRRCGRALVWTSLLNEPLFSMYNLMAVILHKSVGASAFQIALLITAKPLVSLLSVYWSASLAHGVQRLRSNVVWAGVLSRLPFLCFPLFDNVWFLIFAAAIYMLFTRAAAPAWMEMLKLNLPKKERERAFSLGAMMGYGEGVLIAVGFGTLLDSYEGIWKWLFVSSALLGMGSVLLHRKLPIPKEEEPAREKAAGEPFSLRQQLGWLMLPWRGCWKLLRERPDFAHFQWGFMVCGIGIMLIQPALPLFFVDELHLSYTDMAIALLVCKGLGFVCSSSYWAKAMDRFSLAKLSGVIFACVGLFPLCLLFSLGHISWLYIGYGLYGVAQAGSHLIWNLSGPLFAQEKNSSPFTAVNVLMVGLRGCFAPPLGGLCCSQLGSMAVLVGGALFCFYGGWVMRRDYATGSTAAPGAEAEN